LIEQNAPAHFGGRVRFDEPPLPAPGERRLLSRVNPPTYGTVEQEAPDRTQVWHRAPSPTRRGLAAGTVAAAAVVGLLIGFGHRAGTTWRPINAAAHTILGTRADGLWDFDFGVTPTGVAVVLVISVAAGLGVTRIAASFRGMQVVLAAAGVSLVGYLLHLHVVARTPGGLAALLTVGELRALYVTVAVSLIAGMRFAFLPGTEGNGR
jgi:hypothetical protein